MRNPIHALINQVTCSMSPGEAKYETFRSDIFAATNTLMLVWGDLSEAVQLQWERVSANAVDPLMPPAARMWDAHATMTNNADIPLWENLPAHHRAAWEWVFSEQVGPSDIKPAKESEAMEQLRRIRGYSKCFTNAFDRKQAVFVLVEQDASAFRSIAQWIQSNVERLGASHPKIISAKATMARFMESKNQKQAD